MRQEFHQKKAVLEAKRAFIRFVSHEVRTPLNAACLGLQLMHEELEGSTVMKNNNSTKPHFNSDDQNVTLEHHGIQKDTVEAWLRLTGEIQSNTQGAVEVLNDLLKYDKIESGSLTLEFTVLPIWRLVEETVGEFRLSAQQKGVSLRLEFGGEADDFTPECGSDKGNVEIPLTATGLSESIQGQNVVGDRIRLVQVLRNLMSNGLKFTPENGEISLVPALTVIEYICCDRVSPPPLFVTQVA